MAELGAGSGTGYPAALDTDSVTETASDYARIQVPNDLAAAIVAIEAELGVAPSGSYSTVVARLDAILSSGLASARPAVAAGTIGFYYSTDDDVLEFSDGIQWRPVLMGG